MEVTHLDLSDGPPRSHPVVGDAFPFLPPLPSSFPEVSVLPHIREREQGEGVWEGSGEDPDGGREGGRKRRGGGRGGGRGLVWGV